MDASSSDRIIAALSYIPADDREIWVQMGMAIASELGPDGFPIWDTWSNQADNYDPRAAKTTWNSFKANGITIATLFHEAKVRGWPGDGEWKAPTPKEVDARKRSAEVRAAKEDAEIARKREDTAKAAASIWKAASDVKDDHAYLIRKQVHSVPTLREIDASIVAEILGYPPKNKGEPLVGRLLVVPIKVGSRLSTLELIDETGRKSALAGPRTKSGGYWAAQPLPDGTGDGLTVSYSEGTASALTVREATGALALATLGCHNFKHVLADMTSRYPKAVHLICADLGRGQAKAEKVAREFGALMAVPEFTPDEVESFKAAYGKEPTDFNDLAAIRGLDGVRTALSAITASKSDEQETSAPRNDETIKAPSETAPYELNASGVWIPDEDGDKQWICGYLKVAAFTRNTNGESWGRLLEFHDPEGRLHTWAMPIKLLAGDGSLFRETLLDMGLPIAPSRTARNHLATYIQTARPTEYVRCTERTGWCNGKFVLPDETIGTLRAERILFQGVDSKGFRCQGTLPDWQSTIGEWCIGNSRLAFAVSAAFSAPLLSLTGEESGGIHFRGCSSIGKTALLKAATSVCGGPEHLRRWRGTDNALEALAAAHNDALLVLDEIAQVSPLVAGEIAYMLSNGAPKERAQRLGGLRIQLQWRILFLSSGEISLAEHMRSAGKRVRAGQEIRMLDVPVDLGEHGVFESLPAFQSGAGLARAIDSAAAQSHGIPFREYLKKLCERDEAELVKRIEHLRCDFVKDVLPDGAGGQVDRAAYRCALIAAGGELAGEFGIVPWPPGMAIDAAKSCFAAWLKSRGGTGNAEEAQAIAQIRHFLEQHGESRFTPWCCEKCNGSGKFDLPDGEIGECFNCGGTGRSISKTINRSGYRRRTTDGYLYLIMSESWQRNVCEGLDANAVAKFLVKRGIIEPDPKGYPASVHRPPGEKTDRFYAVKEWML